MSFDIPDRARVEMEVARAQQEATDAALREVKAENRRSGLPVCEFCGEPIKSVRWAWRKIIGYEKTRKQGGTNAIALRKPLDEWACDRCVDKLRNGVDPRQEGIW